MYYIYDMRKHLCHFFISLCMGIMLVGCRSAVPIDEVVYEDRQGWVGIRPFPYFVRLICHPKLMTESEFETILSGLRIQDSSSSELGMSNSEPAQSVFTEKQIAWLAPKMVQSLVQAIEEDSVLFRIYDDELNPRHKTEGIFYASEEGYHITLTHYRVPVDKMSEDIPRGSILAKKWRLLFSPQRAILQEQNLNQFFVYEPDFHLGMIHLSPSIIFSLS